MKNNRIVIILIMAVSFISLRSLGQEKNYKDSKSLSEKYFQCLLTNDTSELSKRLIDGQFLLSGIDYSLKGRKDSAHMDSLMRKRFDKMLVKIYFAPFSKLKKLINRENITKGKVDSIKLSKTDSTFFGIEYEMEAFFISNKRKYSFHLSVIDYRNRWYLSEADGSLEGPYGYERTYKGDKIIEEHKIGKDSIIENHSN
jgi:hypothetical protein